METRTLGHEVGLCLDSLKAPLFYSWTNHIFIEKLRITLMKLSEQNQKTHYNKISDAYAAHYGDKWSQKYRNKFINQ